MSATDNKSSHSTGRLLSDLRIKFFSFDSTTLDNAVATVVSAVKRSGAIMLGPIPMPNRKYDFTTVKSPHAFGRSRDPLRLSKHCRLLVLPDANTAIIECIQGITLDGGVGIEIELANS